MNKTYYINIIIRAVLLAIIILLTITAILLITSNHANESEQIWYRACERLECVA